MINKIISAATPIRSHLSIAIVAAALLFFGNAAISVPIVSEDGSYSVDYPAPPKKDDHNDENSRTATYLVVDNNVIYSSGHTVYKQDVANVDAELEANATNFAQAVEAKVTSKKSTRFVRAPGDDLPALEFTVESDKLLGTCLSVVEGAHAYLVVGCSVKPHNGDSEIRAFLKSFKLLKKK
jgi:hypothetical protein